MVAGIWDSWPHPRLLLSGGSGREGARAHRRSLSPVFPYFHLVWFIPHFPQTSRTLSLAGDEVFRHTSPWGTSHWNNNRWFRYSKCKAGYIKLFKNTHSSATQRQELVGWGQSPGKSHSWEESWVFSVWTPAGSLDLKRASPQYCAMTPQTPA